ncbi:MAG: phosphoesterase, partial [Pseudomonadota bacterium]|nr:phosphoesterase [Pseudomonadota bacterium]
HDGDIGLAFGGRARAEWVVGGLCFRHEAETAAAPGEVSGHYHPKARVRHRGRSAGGRCFLADGKRLILPALGAFTGGLDATEPVFAPFFPKGFTAHILIRDRILSVPRGRLVRPLRLRR